MKARFGPQTCGTIIQGVRAGLSLAESAERAGVSPKTVSHWRSRGCAEVDTPHAAFAIELDAAREVAATSQMGDGEFRGHLAKAVRRGSVAAMRLWLRLRSEDAVELAVAGDGGRFDALDALTDSPSRRVSVLDELDDLLGTDTNGRQRDEDVN